MSAKARLNHGVRGSCTDSHADGVGLKVGDITVSFNGVKLEEGAPLIGDDEGMHRGNGPVLRVWRADSMMVVELI